MSELLTSRELAKMLRVSKPTLARWRALDQGPPFVKIEGSVRYPREAVDRWLADRTLGGTLPA